MTAARPISPAAAAMAQAASATLADHDWLADLLAEARQRIRSQLTPAQIEDPSAQDMATGEGIITPLVEAFFATARREGAGLTVEPAAVVREIVDSIFGFGPLAAYMADPEIEEIICNHHADIRIIHALRGKEQTTARFRQASELINFVNRAAREDGRQIDRAHPELNAKMKDGSRLHAIMKPLTAKVEIAAHIEGRNVQVVAARQFLEDVRGLVRQHIIEGRRAADQQIQLRGFQAGIVERFLHGHNAEVGLGFCGHRLPALPS